MFVYDIVNKEGRHFLTHRAISNWENKYSGSINNEMKAEASVCSRNVPFKCSKLPILDDNLCCRRSHFRIELFPEIPGHLFKLAAFEFPD